MTTTATSAARTDRLWVDRLRGVDPLGPLLALAALGVFAAHGLHALLIKDIGLYAYGAQQAVDGVPPYASVLTRIGPMAILVPALGAAGARIVGMDDLLGMRLLLMVISATCVWLLYLLGRDLFGSRFAGAAAAATALTAQGFIVLATGGPREKTVVVLFLTCALLAVVHQRWFLAGAAVSLAALTWQPAFLMGVAPAMVAMSSLRGRAIVGASARFALGGVTPAALCAVGFAIAGAFSEFLNGFLLINVNYPEQSGLLADFDSIAPRVLDGWGPSGWVILAGLVLCLVAATQHLLVAEQRRAPRGMAVVAVGAGAAVGVLFSLRVFNSWPDVLPFLPFAALGFGALAAEVGRRFRPRVAVTLVAGWVVLCLIGGLAAAVATRDNRLEQQRASVAAVLRHAPRGATLMSIEAPQPLVLSSRTNPTRHQMFAEPLLRYIDDSWPGGLEGFAARVEETRPTFIALGNRRNAATWLTPLLQRDYVQVGRAPGWRWLVLRSVGPQEVAILRGAIHTARGTDAATESPSR